MKRLKTDEVERILNIVRKTVSSFSRRKMQEIKNVKYYFGEQWDIDEIMEREKEGKPTLTFNHIKRFVNWLYGTVRGMNVEIRAMPQSIQNEQVANIVSGLIKVAMLEQKNKTQIELATLDGFIRGVGFVHVYPDFFEDPNGKIIIKRIDPLDVYWDTLSESPDLSDAKFVFFVERATRDDLIERYPHKEKEIKNAIVSYTSLRDLLGLKQEEALQIEDYISFWEGLLETAYGKLYPVIHFRESFYATELAIYNKQTDTYINLPSQFERVDVEMYVNALNDKFGENVFKLEEVKVKRWKKITLLGSLVLEYFENPYGAVNYDIIPFFCYKLGRHYQGFVDDLIDPQDEFNWRKSLILEIMKEMPIDSFFIPRGSATEIEIEDMKERLKKRKQLIPIRFEFGQPIPVVSDVLNKLTALIQYEQLLRVDLKEIGGMVDALTGIVPRKLQSGKAIQALQQWGVVPFEAIFTNYYYFLYTIANLVWKISKFVYANKKTVKILLDNTGTSDVVDINIETEAGTLNQILMDEYDVQLVPIASGADEMTEKFMELIQLRQLGVPIPDEFLILFSKVPFKQQIINAIQQMRQQLLQQNQTEGE